MLLARKKRAEAQKAIQETMTGLKDASAFETFERMAGKIDQMEAEAEAATELQEEYTGDTLASQFAHLEKGANADEDLDALKRKMGMIPAEAPAPAKEAVQARVEAPKDTPAEAATRSEQEELAAALEELEAEQNQQEQRKAGR